MRWSRSGAAALALLIVGCATLPRKDTARQAPTADQGAHAKVDGEATAHAAEGPDVTKVRPLYEAGCGSAPRPRGHFDFQIEPARGGESKPVQLKGAGDDLEGATEQRLTAAFVARHEQLARCAGASAHGAQAWFRFDGAGQLRHARSWGLDEPGRACMEAAVRDALAGVDRGRADELSVRIGATAAPGSGSLSKAHIRQTIRTHLGEVRACYELGLGEDPSLEGRVAIKFIIAPDGSAYVAAVARSSLEHPRTQCCIAKSVRTWSFDPPAGGGIVVVTYPFILQQTH
jgi:hypothetical protein